jgi:phage host-nuclease inhibitor protein Gam
MSTQYHRLSEDEANQQFEQLIQARTKLKSIKSSLITQASTTSQDAKAERATFTTGSVTWKKSKDSISLDSKALLKHILNI